MENNKQVSNNEKINQWELFFQKLNLPKNYIEKYSENFTNKNISEEVLISIDDNDLKNYLNINEENHRNIILNYIENLKQKLRGNKNSNVSKIFNHLNYTFQDLKTAYNEYDIIIFRDNYGRIPAKKRKYDEISS